jgi:hypothetical protein
MQRRMCQSIFTVALILAATSPLLAAAAPVNAWGEERQDLYHGLSRK